MQITFCRLFTRDWKTFATLSAVEWTLLSANRFLSLQIVEKGPSLLVEMSNSSVGATLNNFTRKKDDYFHTIYI
jgi:hypothetical protein